MSSTGDREDVLAAFEVLQSAVDGVCGLGFAALTNPEQAGVDGETYCNHSNMLAMLGRQWCYCNRYNKLDGRQYDRCCADHSRTPPGSA